MFSLKQGLHPTMLHSCGQSSLTQKLLGMVFRGTPADVTVRILIKGIPWEALCGTDGSTALASKAVCARGKGWIEIAQTGLGTTGRYSCRLSAGNRFFAVFSVRLCLRFHQTRLVIHTRRTTFRVAITRIHSSSSPGVRPVGWKALYVLHRRVHLKRPQMKLIPFA